MELRKLIKEYLEENRMMQLATSVNNQPWVCNVWYVVDEDLNIYWFSSITRRHSQELEKNNKVAGAMVIPQTPQDKPRGLQFQGTAHMLTDEKDVEKVISLFDGRIFDRETIKDLMAHKEKPHRFYKIEPTQFVLFDAINFPDNSRQEYNL